MEKIKVIKEIVVTKDNAKDIRGVGIPKGTRLHITWIGDKAPFGEGHILMKARVDNGTGLLNLMQETIVRDNEVV